MVGSCGSKIGEDKLENTPVMNWTKVKQSPKIAFEYEYFGNTLKELSENTRNLGERLQYKHEKIGFYYIYFICNSKIIWNKHDSSVL